MHIVKKWLNRADLLSSYAVGQVQFCLPIAANKNSNVIQELADSSLSISTVILADEQDIPHCIVDVNIRLYMVLRCD